MRYRNSQKRLWNKSYTYFITAKTQDNIPYFRNEVLCKLFILQLDLAKSIFNFKLFAFCLNYDHFHILIYFEHFHVSKIMHHLKRNFSRNANIMLGYNKYDLEKDSFQNLSQEGEDYNPRLPTHDDHPLPNRVFSRHLTKLRKFIINHKNSVNYSQEIPQFKWQKSFHDHYIRDQKDFVRHYDYTTNNYLKHNPTLANFSSLKLPHMID